MSISGRLRFLLGVAGLLWPRWAVPDVVVTQPYVGVTHTVRTETTPLLQVVHEDGVLSRKLALVR